jgi:2-dehydropantoate 2-reductase
MNRSGRCARLTRMRFAVLGAGAIGCAIGGRLHQAGHQVTLIARGAQLEALREGGLTLETPDGDGTLPVPAAGSAAEAGIAPGDVVILATKSQDTVAALDELARAQPDAAVVCAQNGVANERMALRRFARVYGMYVFLTAQYLTPGVVQVFCHPVAGLLDIGRYPEGGDDTAVAVAEALTAAGFASRVQPDIMRMKRRKLLGNLVNAIQIVCGGDGDEARELHARAVAEGEACYAAAGLDWASREEVRARSAAVSAPRDVHGSPHRFSSTWQSLQRGTARIETDYLNGEIVLLGRLHGVDTPVNELVRRLANEAAREHRPPASMEATEILDAL